MPDVKVGDRVRVARALLASLRGTGNEDQVQHADELDGLVGTVIPKAPEIEHWPELQVRWDNGLRYMYLPDQLEIVGG